MTEIQPLLDGILVACAVAKKNGSTATQIENIEGNVGLIYKFLELKQPSEEVIQALIQ